MYQTEFNGVHHELGTSGFLYRSNKLMYDHGTKSLWSTLHGEPVIGPLVDQGIKLKREYLVTTTWGAWRNRHPDTTVLSLDTGHNRNYDEGVAYHAYFANDRLMFPVPQLDTRLLNKAEVVALRDKDDSLAIHEEFLRRNAVFHEKIGGTPIVVLTDQSGANRVYESGDVQFKTIPSQGSVTDSQGRTWKIAEDSLSNGTRILKRMPSHRAFWFGWQAQFPKTRLVK